MTTTIRAKAFCDEGIRTYSVQVDEDGSVRVWDDVAGHYTLCHVLNEAAIKRAVEATSG